MEIDDYNSEYFFDQEDLMDEYNSLFAEWDTQDLKDTEEEWDIFNIEQMRNALENYTLKDNEQLASAARKAVDAISDFVNIYDKIKRSK